MDNGADKFKQFVRGERHNKVTMETSFDETNSL